MRCDAMRWSVGGEVLLVAASSKAEGRDVGALETADLRALDSSSSQQQQRAIDGVKGDAAEQGSRPPRAKKEGPRPAGGKLTLLLHVPNRNTFSELIIFL